MPTLRCSAGALLLALLASTPASPRVLVPVVRNGLLDDTGIAMIAELEILNTGSRPKSFTAGLVPPGPDGTRTALALPSGTLASHGFGFVSHIGSSGLVILEGPAPLVVSNLLTQVAGVGSSTQWSSSKM
jgi:hypothetical protein